MFAYSWELLDPDDLASQLDDYDVLIIPWDHEYDWLDDSMIDAIVEFVDRGGTLAMQNFLEGGPDPIFDGFGSKYRIVWIDENGDDVEITRPNHPLVSTPNNLTDEGLSGWGQSYHSPVGDAGSAWSFAADSVDGFIGGCAAYGEGSLVFWAGDPELHEQGDAFKLIENEITIGRSGICAGEEDDDERDQRNPFLGGGVVGAFPQAAEAARANRERANAAGAAAASAAAPAASTTSVRPPSTGDAGLATNNVPSNSQGWPALAAAMAFAAFGLKATWHRSSED